MLTQIQKNKGFTLIELIVALAIALVASASVYEFYIGQQKSYITQDRVTEMQQNLRVAMEIIVRELRMAGFDISLDKSAGAGISNAGANSIRFTMDRNSNGNCNDTDEDITYLLYTSDGIRNLGRRIPLAGGGFQTQPMAPNIEALGFAYAFDNDLDGQLDTDAGQVIWAVNTGGTWFDLDTNDDGVINGSDIIPGGESTGIAVNLNNIRAVRVWLLARTDIPDSDYTNLKQYIVGNQVIDPVNDADASNDHERMRLLSTVVKFRNMGL